MAITKEKKEEIFNKLKKVVKDSPTIVFANFHGLNVLEASLLRKDLKQSNVNYLVTKKTLIKKVLKESGIQGEMPELEGELSLAFGDDQLEPARKVFAFQKKFEERIKILGGVFDGNFMSMPEMTEIASIPPKEVLYAQFVNLINSPIQSLVIGLSKIAEAKR